MLYFLYEYFYSPENIFRFTRLFKSLTIRAMVAFIVSFLIVIFIGRPFIKYLRKKKVGEEIRDLGPQTHYSKKGTPTMGGVLIVTSILTTTVLFGNLTNKFILLLMLITVLFAAIGFTDDYMKWSEKNKKGLTAAGTAPEYSC
jgi:phospho-N-acetylmuramoyl-pentapeptide-transferase